MTSIKLSREQQSLFQGLNAAIEERRVYEERLAAAVAIERGKFAEQIRAALTASIVAAEGLSPDGALPIRLTADCSGLLVEAAQVPAPDAGGAKG